MDEAKLGRITKFLLRGALLVVACGALGGLVKLGISVLAGQ